MMSMCWIDNIQHGVEAPSYHKSPKRMIFAELQLELVGYDLYYNHDREGHGICKKLPSVKYRQQL